MKKVTIETRTTQITGSGKVKPTAPSWVFVNTGTAILYINNNYPLLPGASFGISVDGLLGVFLKEGISVESVTQFEVTFLDVSKADFVTGRNQGLGHLVETFVEYK